MISEYYRANQVIEEDFARARNASGFWFYVRVVQPPSKTKAAPLVCDGAAIFNWNNLNGQSAY